MIEIISLALKLFFLIMGNSIEKNKKKEQEVNEIVDEAKQAFKTGDKAGIINAFSKLNGMR